jgi:hypothetical protein
VARGAHRRDLGRRGFYDDSAAVALMDAWWPLLVRRMFEPVLGSRLMARIEGMIAVDKPPSVSPSSFGVGWYGYVDKDLRTLLAPRRVRGRFSRRYCGRGSLRRCRRVLEDSLAQAVALMRARQGPNMAAWKVYATCPVRPSPQACDQIQFETGGGVDTPPMPWQNRPTFQQAVEVTGRR